MQENILQKLESIEQRLIEQNLLQKEIFTFAEACLYLDLSSSHLYKLTSSNAIPCYCPQGKKLYFRRAELDAWLSSHRNASTSEVEQQAANYIARKGGRLFGLDIVASVRRLGLITFRIAMILSLLRIMDNGSISTLIVCEDTDFQSALAIVEVLLQHTAKVFQTLQPTTADTPTEKTQIRQQYFDNLPPDFDRTAIVATAQKLGIPPKTAERYIKQWCDTGQITHVSHGLYSKPK